MVQISEATLSQAMKFTYDNFIKSLDPDEIIGYAPETQKDVDYLRENPYTGKLFLKKYKDLKQAWVLVKFTQREDAITRSHTKYNNTVKITNDQEFQNFFGVSVPPNFTLFNQDLVVYARWNKTSVKNKYADKNFDETTPDFYMYTNHRKVNLDVLIKRLYRLQDWVDTDPKAVIGNKFNIPYTLTNVKQKIEWENK